MGYLVEKGTQSTIRNLQGAGSIDTSSGRVRCGNDTTAWPGAQPWQACPQRLVNAADRVPQGGHYLGVGQLVQDEVVAQGQDLARQVAGQLRDERQAQPALAAALGDAGDLLEQRVHTLNPVGAEEFVRLFHNQQHARRGRRRLAGGLGFFIRSVRLVLAGSWMPRIRSAMAKLANSGPPRVGEVDHRHSSRLDERAVGQWLCRVFLTRWRSNTFSRRSRPSRLFTLPQEVTLPSISSRLMCWANAFRPASVRNWGLNGSNVVLLTTARHWPKPRRAARIASAADGRAQTRPPAANFSWRSISSLDLPFSGQMPKSRMTALATW